MKCRLILIHWNQGAFQRILELEFSTKCRFPKKKLSLAEGLENFKVRIYKEMSDTNQQNVLMGNPKSGNRWREYHLMFVGENQFRCSIKNRISAGKTLFPGNSIIFATFPPHLFPPVRLRFRGNRNSIRAFKSADSFIRQDRFQRHRLFELKRAAPFQTSQNVSICAPPLQKGGKKSQSLQ